MSENLEFIRPDRPTVNCHYCNEELELTFDEAEWEGRVKERIMAAVVLKQTLSSDALKAHLGRFELSQIWRANRHADCDVAFQKRREDEENERRRQEYWQHRQHELDEFFKSPQFPRDMETRTFETFDQNENSDALSLLKSWKMGDEFGFLIMGPSGCGKTHLLHSLVNLIAPEAKLGYWVKDCVIFVNTAEFLNVVRRDLETGEQFGRAKTAAFLFLDDLGVENLTDWSRDELYRLFEYRLNNRLPTFITTNLNLEELKTRLHERLLSRLKDMCVFVPVKGRDRRTDFMKTRMKTLIERSNPNAEAM